MNQEQPLDIVALYKEAAFEVVGKKLDDLTLDTQLSALGLDSVAIMEIVGYVEDRVGVRVNDEDLSRLTTLRELADLIEKGRAPLAVASSIPRP